MAVTEVELYTPPITGTALDPARIGPLEHEVTLLELAEKLRHAKALGLTQVVATCAQRTTRTRLSQQIDFPLLTEEEVRIWRAFLPTAYTSDPRYEKAWPGNVMRGPYGLASYAFDLPPVSVLELWSTLQSASAFDVYEIWTPERPMPEPILLGYKEQVGPFLLARWGESLAPFEAIKKEVEARTATWNAVSTTPNLLVGTAFGGGVLAGQQLLVQQQSQRDALVALSTMQSQ